MVPSAVSCSPASYSGLRVQVTKGFLEGPLESPDLFCLFRRFSASGDMRTNGDKYLYEIQLSSITSSTNPACSGANICQVKPNDQHFSRKVGTSDKTKYYVQGNSLPPCATFNFLGGTVTYFHERTPCS